MGHITRKLVETPSNQPIGSVMTVDFTLNGQNFQGLNGGPFFKFTEAISMVVKCQDQNELDYYYEKLSAVPDAEQCGWIRDKYGLSWQLVPKNISELMNQEGETGKRVMDAVMNMKRLDFAELQRVAEGS
jgi:predicted 3-demethylubiquinone-9 3-methyltransferase (glyoxalase superfamily)